MAAVTDRRLPTIATGKPLPVPPSAPRSPKIPTQQARERTSGEENKMTAAISTFLDESAKQEALKKQLAEGKAAEAALRDKKATLVAQSKASEAKIQGHDDKIAETHRAAVRTILSKNVFGVDVSVLTSTFSPEVLDKVRCDLVKKKCLIADDVGVESVIVPFLQKQPKITSVNLSHFKDEIALVKFFQALPTTHVTSVIIAKPLTADESSAKLVAEHTIAKLGRQLVVTMK